MTRLTLFFLLLALTGRAQHPALLPLPRELLWTKQPFVLTGSIQLKTNRAEANPIADSIALFIRQVSRATVSQTTASAMPAKEIDLRLEPNGAFSPQPEGYALTVSGQSVQLRAATVRGLFWGYQTLRQLHQANARPTLAGCDITDYPAFAIRGFMHDVGRSFIPVERLKQHIAILARYKINTFHWHLTEDLAWRLQSDSIPNLTDASVTKRFPGQVYTKQQARELVDFCKAHQVLLIPELDMPGHSAAFKRATGYDMQSDSGKVLVKKLLREVCALFDVPYIHIGTDEVAFKDASFVPEMAAVVRDCGKDVIGWIPGARLEKSVIRQMWMGTIKPKPGQPVIDSRDLYFNHYSTQADLMSLFQRDLCDTTSGSPDRLGAIGCVWNDRKLTDVDQIERLNGFYPNMLTLAERSWRGGGRPLTKAGPVLVDKTAFAEFENRLLAHKQQHFAHLIFPYVRQQNLNWRLLRPVPNGGDLTTRFSSEDGQLDSFGLDATGATIYLRHTWGPDIVRGYLDKPQPNHTAYAYTFVYSPGAQTVGAWVGFHNHGRSEKDASSPAGQWDYKGSKLWVNDQEIQPPTWKTPRLHPADNETVYTDEPYENRPPLPITLKKGWNKVLIKLPVGTYQTADYRLVKWQFTFVFVRTDGLNYTTADELIFSPDKRQ